MKCIRCGHDSKHKDRTGRICPQCKGRFAFEPQEGDPVTDMLFTNAIAAVSGEGRIKWGIEHLYYEVNRRKRRKRLGPVYTIPMLLAGLVFLYFFLTSLGMRNIGFPRMPLAFPFGIVIGGILIVVALYSLLASSLVAIAPEQFRRLWDRWCEVHGEPKGVIKRSLEIEQMHRAARRRDPPASPAPASAQPAGGAPPFGRRGNPPAAAVAAAVPAFGKRGAAAAAPLEADIADYSFDRAVICDRARTADLLIANNFHFENNCAILSIDGYPENVFDTVKAMIKRNPRLHVFTLHDATPDGCRLATGIAYAADWFDGRTTVVDLGLRPRHAGLLHGLLQSADAGAVVKGGGLDESEAKWLSRYKLELAAVRPEDVLKRLFRGIQAHNNDDTSGGGATNCDSFDSTSHGDSPDSADSFG